MRFNDFLSHVEGQLAKPPHRRVYAETLDEWMNEAVKEENLEAARAFAAALIVLDAPGRTLEVVSRRPFEDIPAQLRKIAFRRKYAETLDEHLSEAIRDENWPASEAMAAAILLLDPKRLRGR
jgi:hypothetical protein